MLSILYLLKLSLKQINQRKLLFVIFLLMSSSLLEFSLIITLPSVIKFNNGETSFLSDDHVFLYIFNHLGLFNFNTLFLLTFFFSMLVSFFSLKGVFTLSAQSGIKFADEIFKKFIAQNYDNQIHSEKSIIQNLLTVEITRVVDGILLPISQLVARGTTAISITLALFLMNWKLTSILFLSLFVLYGLLFSIQIKKVTRFGSSQTTANQNRAKLLSRFFYDHKNNLLFNREAQIVQELGENSDSWSASKAGLQTMGVLPRYVIDAGLIFGIVVFAIYTGNTSNQDGVLGIIGFTGSLAYAILKLIPFIQQAYLTLVSVIGAQASAQEIMNLVTSLGESAVRSISADHLSDSIKKIKVDDLYHVPLKQLMAFELVSGKLNIVTGRSGIGKTWLVDTLVGLRSSDQKISFMMHSGEHFSGYRDIRVAGVSYVEQEVTFPATSICNFITGKEFSSLVTKEQEKLKAAIKLAQLQTERNLNIYSNIPVADGGANISGGQKRRICIARALYEDSGIIILDEPTNGLDATIVDELIIVLKQLSTVRIILCITHDQKILSLDSNLIKLCS